MAANLFNHDSDRERIRSQGRPITLGGQPHRVRMGMLAIAYLEDRYDGLDGYIQALAQKGWGSGKVRACIAGMVAGLLHEESARLGRQPIDEELEQFENTVAEALDGSVDGLITWIAIVAAALDDSWPAPRPGSPPKGQGRRPSISPGLSSTTSRRSPSTARRHSSGK